MNLYYWKGKKNFGDLLSGLLLERFCGLKSQWAEPGEADLVMCGSVLEHLPNDYAGMIAGAGKLHEKTKIDLPYAKILALRGPLSAKGISGNFVLGDPGLLADELVKIENKEYSLGIVPHWSDTVLGTKFKKWRPHIINVADDPLHVITEIAKCKKIVSSSLHGIILADALQIPRRIELAPRMITHSSEGGVFKWKDYCASLNMKFETGRTQQTDRNKVVDIQHELFDVFEEIKSSFK